LEDVREPIRVSALHTFTILNNRSHESAFRIGQHGLKIGQHGISAKMAEIRGVAGMFFVVFSI